MNQNSRLELLSNNRKTIVDLLIAEEYKKSKLYTSDYLVIDATKCPIHYQDFMDRFIGRLKELGISRFLIVCLSNIKTLFDLKHLGCNLRATGVVKREAQEEVVIEAVEVQIQWV